MDWSLAKTIAEVVKEVLTSVALVLGGYWFLWRRDPFPRASVSIAVEEILLDSDHRLLHVETTLTNVGKTLIEVRKARGWVQRMLPLEANLQAELRGEVLIRNENGEIPWPRASDMQDHSWGRGRCRIEPGESEIFRWEYVIDATIQVVLVYAYIENADTKRRREIGWSRTQFVRLDSKGAPVMSNGPSRGEERQLPPRLVPVAPSVVQPMSVVPTEPKPPVPTTDMPYNPVPKPQFPVRPEPPPPQPKPKGNSDE